jgi:hypothetical protein
MLTVMIDDDDDDYDDVPVVTEGYRVRAYVL